jgi:hypothetical protein
MENDSVGAVLIFSVRLISYAFSSTAAFAPACVNAHNWYVDDISRASEMHPHPDQDSGNNAADPGGNHNHT